MTLRPLGRAVLLIAALAPLTVAACNAGSGSPDPDAPIVVTFEVVDERFKALLTDPADIAIARRLLAGEDAPSIPTAGSSARPASTPDTAGRSTPTTSSSPT
jgi:hypothetical protein